MPGDEVGHTDQDPTGAEGPVAYTWIMGELPRLKELGLASDLPVAGFFPETSSGWMTITPAGRPPMWVRIDAVEAAEAGTLDTLLAHSSAEQERLDRHARRLRFGGILAFTIFLPITALGALPVPARPGSPYTLGQALVGFLTFLAIPVLVFALITQRWLLAGTCVYWWVGSKVLESQLRTRGYMS